MNGNGIGGLLTMDAVRQAWRALLAHTAAPHDFDPDDLPPIPESEAERAARSLVRDTLPAETWRALERDGYLDLPSTLSPNRGYRVHRDPVENRTEEWTRATEEDPWAFSERLCVIPDQPGYPPGDHFLTHYLWLLTDEAEFRRVANHIPLPNQAYRPGPLVEAASTRLTDAIDWEGGREARAARDIPTSWAWTLSTRLAPIPYDRYDPHVP